MTSFIITGADTTARVLGTVESGVVTSGAALSVVGTAVTLTGFANLTVQGTIIARDYGAVSTDGGQFTIASDGVITAVTVALLFVGNAGSGGVLLNNAGTIAAGSAVEFSGPVLRVANSGDITGFGFAAMSINSQDGAVHIRNSGMIAGGQFGISSTGNSVERITNAGVISGMMGAMTLSDAVSIVTNTGLLDGMVSLNGGADWYDGSLGVQEDVFGGAGADTVFGGAGNDGLDGGSEADVLRGMGGDDDLSGGTGQDSLGGGEGDDALSGGLDGDSLFGGAGDDEVLGDDGNDLLGGGLGNDLLNGGLLNDTVSGSFGDDTVIGSSGNDVLYGGADDDALSGGAGLDTLRGGQGDDTLSGSTGADTFVFARGQGTDRVTDFVNNVDKLDLRAFDLGSLAAVTALASASGFGLRIDVPGEGMIFVTGLTLATLSAADVLL